MNTQKPKLAHLCFFASLMTASAMAFAGDRPDRPAPWVIHEWGTFTSLQDERGQAIGGINTDDEPAPPFVHRLAGYLLLNPTEVPKIFCQGAPSCHPDVTMRLETPVLYFHPPASPTQETGINVTATFRGGWLSEFYPEAEAVAPGVQVDPRHPAGVFGALRSDTVSTLAWNDLQVGGDWRGPETTAHVWTAPRAVEAASVRATNGEAEKFLFYRGVAHIDAPLATLQDANIGELFIRSQCAPEIAGRGLEVRSLWLVDIRADGEVAFRGLSPVTLAKPGEILAKTSSHFNPSDYSAANRETLGALLQKALIAEGLFRDEATALLNTWELSYFKSAGLRVFFLVPQAWTDFYLPLNISPSAQVTRVMVGRLELVTPGQRETLGQMGKLSPTEIANDVSLLFTNFYSHLSSTGPEGPKRNELAKVMEGAEPLHALGVTIPRSYQLYLNLGRFRNALILDEATRRPSAGLDKFISTYRLQGYAPPPKG